MTAPVPYAAFWPAHRFEELPFTDHEQPFNDRPRRGRMELSASTTPEAPMTLLSNIDVVLLVLAAPIMVLIGVPAGGYLIAAGAWIALRAIGIGVERVARSGDPRREIGLRLGYMLGRLFALALTVILVRKAGSKDDGLTALIVIVFAFTVQLGSSAITRPRSR
jgi:hypothetical protein